MRFLPLLLLGACMPADPITVMTWNIRWPAPSDGPNGWEYRRDTVTAAIRGINPDLAGFQEVHPEQFAALQAALTPTHTVLGFDRGDGEHLVIAIRSDRFLITDVGPVHKVSYYTDGNYARLLVQVSYVDRQTDRPGTFLVTHIAGTAEELAAIADLLPPGPVLLVGDFNALTAPNPWGVEPLQPILTAAGRLVDTWTAAHPGTPGLSGCGWDPCQVWDFDARIDWVLSGGYETLDAHIPRPLTPTGRNASDHWPVVAVVTP